MKKTMLPPRDLSAAVAGMGLEGLARPCSIDARNAEHVRKAREAGADGEVDPDPVERDRAAGVGDDHQVVMASSSFDSAM